jgi:hypothetical protein
MSETTSGNFAQGASARISVRSCGQLARRRKPPFPGISHHENENRGPTDWSEIMT